MDCTGYAERIDRLHYPNGIAELTSIATRYGAGLRALLLLSAAAALLIALHNTNVQAVGLWQRTALNASHVFVFALVALALLVVTAQLRRLSSWQQFSVALLSALVAGTASEAAQINTLRDASLQDLLSNWLGATGALLLGTAFRLGPSTSKLARVKLVVIGALVLIVALLPLLKVSAAYVERNADRASLVSFDDFFVRTFVTAKNASLTIVEIDETRIGRVTLERGPWPGLIFHDVWPDWRGYSNLVVELSLPERDPLTVNIRVHDRMHRVGEQPYHDRFNTRYELTPGANTVRIPLEIIRNAPQGRPMDLSQIDGIVVFFASKNAGRRFDLVRITLE